MWCTVLVSYYDLLKLETFTCDFVNINCFLTSLIDGIKTRGKIFSKLQNQEVLRKDVTMKRARLLFFYIKGVVYIAFIILK